MSTSQMGHNVMCSCVECQSARFQSSHLPMRVEPALDGPAGTMPPDWFVDPTPGELASDERDRQVADLALAVSALAGRVQQLEREVQILRAGRPQAS